MPSLAFVEPRRRRAFETADLVAVELYVIAGTASCSKLTYHFCIALEDDGLHTKVLERA
jgi:hypothetical protein